MSQEKIREIVESRVPEHQREGFLRILKKAMASGDPSLPAQYKKIPVSVEEFLHGDHFLRIKRTPESEIILKAAQDMCSGDYYEAVLTGAIGTFKTTIALIVNAYQLYEISCLKSPHDTFGILPSDEILFVFQNMTATLAKGVDFERFKALIEGAPYFQQEFPFDKNITSRLEFPNRIKVVPVAGMHGAIGQNVFGGLVDEVNFWRITENSKRSRDGERVDEAEEAYNTISTRRKSRFLEGGRLPGILCLVSSRYYPGQFTDRKEEERNEDLRERGYTGIYLYDKRLWEIRPDRFKDSKWFRMFVGNESRKPRILTDDDVVLETEKALVWMVPEEFQIEFRRDPYKAIRDILGLSTLAKHPFIPDVESIDDCLDRKLLVINTPATDFDTLRLKLFPSRFINPRIPRWVHIDLGLTSDSAGICCAHVPEFVAVERGNEVREVLPFIHVDFALEVRPPAGGEIQFAKIREILITLRDHGVNLQWVSFDSWQSVDSIQILNQKGFQAGTRSVDKTTVPYDMTKSALSDRRVSCPDVPRLRTELRGLEMDKARGKVDHPPRGSKDISDALAGCVHGLSLRAEVWAFHSIPTHNIPASIERALAA